MKERIKMFTYPRDITGIIKKVWTRQIFPNQKCPPLPNDTKLMELIENVYHASFLTEESRKLEIRVIFAKPEELKKVGNITTVQFIKEREFNVAEILRLSPALDPQKMLILVRLNNSDNLVIWGIIDIGSSWWNFIHEESTSGSLPPPLLTVSSLSPGEISISRSGTILINLRNGKIDEPLREVIYNEHFKKFFNNSRKLFYKEICTELHTKNFDPSGKDDDYPQRRYLMHLERLIFTIRNKNHGGTLIFVPDKIKSNDSRLRDRINIKYDCVYDECWELFKKEMVMHRKYYDLHFGLWGSKEGIKQTQYHDISVMVDNRKEVDLSIRDAIRFISSLTGIDGAVIITDKFKVLGFGGEVIALSPSLEFVKVAIDIQGKQGTNVPIESFGTRHRSAFRFCSSFEDSFAIVISQDGGVKAIKRCGENLILWPDINVGNFGI